LAQVSPLDFDDWRNQNKVFDHMAAFVGGELNLMKSGRRKATPRTSVSSGFFEAVGARPFLGRVFVLADEESGRDDIVILSYSLWQRHFGSDPNIVGKKVSFNAEDLTVVGVMPKGFEYPGKADLPPDFHYQSHTEAWTPLAIKYMQLGRGVRCLSVIARMRPDVTLSDARKEMEAIANNLQQQNPQTNKGWGVHLVALQNQRSTKSE
jgi:putative ABC transport system permease protein